MDRRAILTSAIADEIGVNTVDRELTNLSNAIKSGSSNAVKTSARTLGDIGSGLKASGNKAGQVIIEKAAQIESNAEMLVAKKVYSVGKSMEAATGDLGYVREFKPSSEYVAFEVPQDELKAIYQKAYGQVAPDGLQGFTGQFKLAPTVSESSITQKVIFVAENVDKDMSAAVLAHEVGHGAERVLGEAGTAYSNPVVKYISNEVTADVFAEKILGLQGEEQQAWRDLSLRRLKNIKVGDELVNPKLVEAYYQQALDTALVKYADKDLGAVATDLLKGKTDAVTITTRRVKDWVAVKSDDIVQTLLQRRTDFEVKKILEPSTAKVTPELYRSEEVFYRKAGGVTAKSAQEIAEEQILQQRVQRLIDKLPGARKQDLYKSMKKTA